jgi:thiol-disulfide isomerase/thioredoxin
VTEAIDDFQRNRAALASGGAMKTEEYERLKNTALDGLAIDSLTPRQIAMIHRENLLAPSAYRHAAIDRLDAFSDDTGEPGAVTAILRLALLGGRGGKKTPEPKQQAALLDAVLAHPALPAAIRSGAARDLFSAIGALQNATLYKEAAPKLLLLETALGGTASPLMAQGLSELFDVAMAAAPDAAAKETWREKIVSFGRGALEKTENDPAAFSKPVRDHLARTVKRLDGAAARGKLVGSPAPALTFAWASVDGLHSLEDLKGKVVVLDFWATWCGPCVASIPNVRELAAHYKDFPVAIVGVTSLQGNHIDPDDGAIDTKGDPGKEHSLMPGFMKKKDITWPIAFSSEEVFNPDYGVEGIPHVVILDPKGIVRYSGLHPGDPLAEKAKKIDALLKEAGLAAPAPTQGN